MADKKFDDIFEPTAQARRGRRKKETEEQAAPEPASEAEAIEAEASEVGELTISPFHVLKTLFRSHGEEIIYRRGREERAIILTWAIAGLLSLLAVIAFAGPWSEASWLWRWIFKAVLIGSAFAIAGSGNKLIEINRKRLQELLGLMVKISGRLRLYEEGVYLGPDEPLYHGSFKFLGSLADDETNVGSLLVKAAFAISTLVIILA